jgi:hypothetical protein
MVHLVKEKVSFIKNGETTLWLFVVHYLEKKKKKKEAFLFEN